MLFQETNICTMKQLNKIDSVRSIFQEILGEE